MDYEKSKRMLEEHFSEHPEEYENIASLLENSGKIDGFMTRRKRERIAKIEYYRRQLDGE